VAPTAALPEAARWTEAMLTGLEPSEHDFQEFKGSLFLADGDQIVSGFQAALSRQASAFANGAGGRIFIGIDDAGRIDGGVPVGLKGGGTRAWLEDVLTTSVDPPLRAFNVYEVRGAGSGPSRIRSGHAVYVLEIDPSEDAPHQALDHRYYLRIAGKSRPMGHVHLQDILQRTRHPKATLVRIDPWGEPERLTDDPRGPKTMVCFHTLLGNLGRNLAHHVGVEVTLPRVVVNSEARARTLEQSGTTLTQRPGELVFFRYYPIPLFPGQETSFQRFWVALHAGNIERWLGAKPPVMRWRVFADDAPPREGVVTLTRFAHVRRELARWTPAPPPP
jgi:hypothetical protein